MPRPPRHKPRLWPDEAEAVAAEEAVAHPVQPVPLALPEPQSPDVAVVAAALIPPVRQLTPPLPRAEKRPTTPTAPNATLPTCVAQPAALTWFAIKWCSTTKAAN